MLKNGTKVRTPKGEGVIKSTIGGYYGYYYVVEINGERHSIIDKEVEPIEADS